MDHTPWEHPFGDTPTYRGYDVELLSFLDLDTSSVCPANTTFEIYLTIIDGPNGDEAINLNVVVETAQNATVRIGLDDGLTW
jgi:hypothetical protein